MAGSFQLTNTTMQANSTKKIISITVALKMNDASGAIGITDIMLQRGTISTEWAAHPAEIKWAANE